MTINAKWLKAFQVFASVLALMVIVAFLSTNAKSVAVEISKLTLGEICLALMVSIGISAIGGFSWKPFIDGHIGVLTVIKINSTGQLAKYVPGSVWSYTAQAAHFRTLGYSSRIMVLSMLIATGVSVISGLALGPVVAESLDNSFISNLLKYGPFFCLLLIPVLFRKLINVFSKIFRIDDAALKLNGKAIFQSFFVCILTWVLFGFQIIAISGNAFSPTIENVTEMSAAAGVAISMSIFFFLFPAGIGVRELFFVWILTPSVSTSQAAVIALLSRLMVMLADVIVFTSLRVRKFL